MDFPDDADYSTVAGFLLRTLGDIPDAGAEVTYQNLRFRVLEADDRRVLRVRIERIPEETESTDTAPSARQARHHGP